MGESSVITRSCLPGLKITIPTGATGLSGPIDIRQYAGGGVRIPSDWVAADISFLVSHLSPTADIRSAKTPPDPSSPQSESFVPLRDTLTGDLVRITNVDPDVCWVPIPDEVFVFAYIKLKATNTASEAAVDETTSPTLFLALKG